MIKMKFKRADGKSAYLFGLSDLNIEKLKEGRPIEFDGKMLGIDGIVTIVYGKTEESIAKDLGIKLP